MKRLQIARPSNFLLATWLVASLALLVVVPAQGAALHVVTVKLEFSDDPTTAPVCAGTTVVLSAASCDAAVIAAELEAEMVAAGLTAPLFPFLPICALIPSGEWDCVYGVPAGCVQDDIQVSVQVGTTCVGTSNVTGTASDTFGGIGEFLFEI